MALAVSESVSRKRFPLVLAGNCNTSVGVHAGLNDASAGVLSFDAHPDFDTPDEAISGYFDGMGVATLAGQCWRKLAASVPGHRPLDLAKLVYCGIRDFGPGQREKVEAHEISSIYGGADRPTDFARELESQLTRFPARALIHLDLDCLDTSLGRANEYASPGGLLAEDLLRCLALALTRTRPSALTIASFNPDLADNTEIVSTALAAASLIGRHSP